MPRPILCTLLNIEEHIAHLEVSICATLWYVMKRDWQPVDTEMGGVQTPTCP